jgi:hypothetical protein
MHILMCPATKDRNNNTCGIVSLNPYPSVDDHFSLFYAGIDGVKVVLNSRQQHPHT